MELKEKIKANLSEIKKLVFNEDGTPEEKAFVDAKTVNGDILKVEPAIEVGATVSVIAEDGETAPAPDGEHELEDGSVITVESGVISNVVEVAEEKPEEMSENKPEEKEEFNAEKFEADIKAYIDNAIKEAVEGIDLSAFAKEDAVKELDEKFSAVTEKTLEVIEEVANAEAVEPDTKVERNKFTKKSSGRLTPIELMKLKNQ